MFFPDLELTFKWMSNVDPSIQNIKKSLKKIVGSTPFEPHAANLASIRYNYLFVTTACWKFGSDLLSLSDLTRYLAWAIVLYINAGIS